MLISEPVITTTPRGKLSLLQRVFPGLAREHSRLDKISEKTDRITQSYDEMTTLIQKEVDENHFSPYLNYERKS